jgi:hypothetical protein
MLGPCLVGYLRLGGMSAKAGRHEAAVSWLRRAVAVGEDDGDALSALADLLQATCNSAASQSAGRVCVVGHFPAIPAVEEAKKLYLLKVVE